MKKILSIFSLLIYSTSFAQEIDIRDAAKQDLVSYMITGSWSASEPVTHQDANGLYYGKCMLISLFNMVEDTLDLEIKNGMMLISEDTLVQNMLITKPVYITLLPDEMQTFHLYAMCSEMNDRMPDRGVKYTLGDMANDQLVRIATIIDETFMQNVVGQGSVWAYTDNASEADLRKYGASDASLKLSLDILKKANINTQLSVHFAEKEKAQMPIEEAQSDASSESESKGILISSVIIYLAGGFLLILIVIVVYLLIRNGRKKQLS